MSRRIPVVVVSWAVLLTAALSLASCGSETTVGTSTTQAVTTDIRREPATTMTTDGFFPMTTSPVFAANSQKSMEAALELGDAVISYLSEKGDLATVQSLVAPSAHEGLAQMLSALVEPTGCKVLSTGSSDPYGEIEVVLVFADGKSQQPGFNLTAVADSDRITIAGIGPNSTPGPFEQAEPKYQYLNTDYAYYTAEAVALATVVDVLPLRRNPLAGTGDPDGPSEHQPIVYKGYVLQVEKAYGPGSISERITVYALGNGTVVLGGVTYEVREEYPLDASPGDTFFVPLTKAAYFGTPELEQDEYWVQANWAVFAVDDNGRCTRVTGADLDPESRSEFPLSSLENVALEQGKLPSLVD